MYKSRIPEYTKALPHRIDGAMAEAAYIVAEDAKMRVPVETGQLRAAIHVERHGSSDYSVVAGNRKAFYGFFIEFGTVKKSARPFLLPALESNRHTILDRAQRAL